MKNLGGYFWFVCNLGVQHFRSTSFQVFFVTRYAFSFFFLRGGGGGRRDITTKFNERNAVPTCKQPSLLFKQSIGNETGSIFLHNQAVSKQDH